MSKSTLFLSLTNALISFFIFFVTLYLLILALETKVTNRFLDFPNNDSLPDIFSDNNDNRMPSDDPDQFNSNVQVLSWEVLISIFHICLTRSVPLPFQLVPQVELIVEHSMIINILVNYMIFSRKHKEKKDWKWKFTKSIKPTIVDWKPTDFNWVLSKEKVIGSCDVEYPGVLEIFRAAVIFKYLGLTWALYIQNLKEYLLTQKVLSRTVPHSLMPPLLNLGLSWWLSPHQTNKLVCLW